MEELRPIYREKYPDKVKKIVVPLSPARLQKAQSMRRLVLPKRGRRATHKKEHETIFRDLAFKKLQKLQQESTLIIWIIKINAQGNIQKHEGTHLHGEAFHTLHQEGEEVPRTRAVVLACTYLQKVHLDMGRVLRLVDIEVQRVDNLHIRLILEVEGTSETEHSLAEVLVLIMEQEHTEEEQLLRQGLLLDE